MAPPLDIYPPMKSSRSQVKRSLSVRNSPCGAPDQSIDVVATIETRPDAATQLEIGAQTATAP